MSAVAACAVAAFLWPDSEIRIFAGFNICVTIFIYYNGMALNDPTKDKTSLAGPFLVV